jgi:hypothetical protein
MVPLSYFPRYVKFEKPMSSFNKLLICRNPYDRCVSNFIWQCKINKQKIKNIDNKFLQKS